MILHIVRLEIERGFEVGSVEIAIAEEYLENLPSIWVLDRLLHREIVIESQDAIVGKDLTGFHPLPVRLHLGREGTVKGIGWTVRRSSSKLH